MVTSFTVLEQYIFCVHRSINTPGRLKIFPLHDNPSSKYVDYSIHTHSCRGKKIDSEILSVKPSESKVFLLEIFIHFTYQLKILTELGGGGFYSREGYYVLGVNLHVCFLARCNLIGAGGGARLPHRRGGRHGPSNSSGRYREIPSQASSRLVTSGLVRPRLGRWWLVREGSHSTRYFPCLRVSCLSFSSDTQSVGGVCHQGCEMPLSSSPYFCLQRGPPRY